MSTFSSTVTWVEWDAIGIETPPEEIMKSKLVVKPAVLNANTVILCGIEKTHAVVTHDGMAAIKEHLMLSGASKILIGGRDGVDRWLRDSCYYNGDYRTLYGVSVELHVLGNYKNNEDRNLTMVKYADLLISFGTVLKGSSTHDLVNAFTAVGKSVIAYDDSYVKYI